MFGEALDFVVNESKPVPDSLKCAIAHSFEVPDCGVVCDHLDILLVEMVLMVVKFLVMKLVSFIVVLILLVEIRRKGRLVVDHCLLLIIAIAFDLESLRNEWYHSVLISGFHGMG